LNTLGQSYFVFISRSIFFSTERSSTRGFQAESGETASQLKVTVHSSMTWESYDVAVSPACIFRSLYIFKEISQQEEAAQLNSAVHYFNAFGIS